MLITRAITHAIFDLFDLALSDSDSALLVPMGYYILLMIQSRLLA